MNRLKAAAFLVLLVHLFASSAQADQALANAKGCLACHELKTKKVGPSYLDVAKKYTGQADAPAKLAQKVLEGGSGVWSPVAMPANKKHLQRKRTFYEKEGFLCNWCCIH